VVEVLGCTEGSLSFEGKEYANGASFTSTQFLTAADVAAKEVEGYTASVTLDKDNAKAIVNYTTSTGINDVPTTARPTVIYDLSGRRVKEAKKGVYIVNGQKAIF
jgi:hypothetical protein